MALMRAVFNTVWRRVFFFFFQTRYRKIIFGILRYFLMHSPKQYLYVWRNWLSVLTTLTKWDQHPPLTTHSEKTVIPVPLIWYGSDTQIWCNLFKVHLKGAISRGYCCFRSILCWSQNLLSYPYTKCSVRDKACVTGTWKWWAQETTGRARETRAHSF